MSLGWLTESTIIPTKKKAIGGITSNSLVNLKAALYDSQQVAKKHRTGPKVERSVNSGKNQGVENRIQRDLQRLRADTQSTSFEASQEALRRKAELYQKMMSGELEMNEEEQLVDFDIKIFRKESVPSTDQGPTLLEADDHDQRYSSSSNSNEHHVNYTRTAKSKGVVEVSKKTESARELVKKIRKQRKQKVQNRIAKLKSRANSYGGFASRIIQTTTGSNEQQN